MHIAVKSLQQSRTNAIVVKVEDIMHSINSKNEFDPQHFSPAFYQKISGEDLPKNGSENLAARSKCYHNKEICFEFLELTMTCHLLCDKSWQTNLKA